MNKEYKELQQEEQEIYYKIENHLNGLTDDERLKFFKLLEELIDVEINLEKFCNE